MIEPRDDFERELRDRLQPCAAPQGFADRVMARVPARPARWNWARFSAPAWRWAIAAVLVVGVVIGGLERERQQRMQGERARDQVLLALRITGSTLREVSKK